MLSAAHATASRDARGPHRQRFDLPLLYLHREREATAGVEPALDIHESGSYRRLYSRGRYPGLDRCGVSNRVRGRDVIYFSIGFPRFSDRYVVQ
jgi:hypothetical protein